MEQIAFFDAPGFTENLETACFSAENFSEQSARISLEKKYSSITEITETFTRKSVSHQLSKNDCLHRWLKYREGFSAELVAQLLSEFNISKGDTLLDPFLGSGTTALVGCLNGINCIGFDILPMVKIAVTAKSAVFDYNIQELLELLEEINNLRLPRNYQKKTPSLAITEGAFTDETAREISFSTEWNQENNFSENAKNLVVLCTLNALEKVSYTAKDGQYLRWDYRSSKIHALSENRKKMVALLLLPSLIRARYHPSKLYFSRSCGLLFMISI